jgi:uncharacterized protein YdiU (UPF0061 family)
MQQISMPGINLVKRFANLAAPFHTPVNPTPLSKPYWLHINHKLAEALNIQDFGSEDWLLIISGNKTFEGYPPLASLYAGHQFGIWVPQLGDGRAMFIAEHMDLQGQTWELQLKGAGVTPFSRMGDGKAVLRSTIREYLASHAMQCLHVPTTYALAMVGSQDPVYREKVETAAIVLRLATSFIRFGHLEVLGSRGLTRELEILIKFIINNFFPQLANNPNPYLAFFQQVVQLTAQLIAKWQAVGFCHGVMNTDNMSILGLTIDYGPFGFLDKYNPQHICNHSDVEGRYAYCNQPYIGWWNLKVLAYTLSSIIKQEEVEQALQDYALHFNNAYLTEMGKKLGDENFTEQDLPLLTELLAILEACQTDWTIFWRKLSYLEENKTLPHQKVIDEITDQNRFKVWLNSYFKFIQAKNLTQEKRQLLMLNTNPKYILRNYLLQQAIEQAERGDFSEVAKLFKIITKPYDEQPEYEDYANYPPDWADSITVSCSS